MDKITFTCSELEATSTICTEWEINNFLNLQSFSFVIAVFLFFYVLNFTVNFFSK